MSETIAFIGTGIMGGPMARNLLKAGYKVRAFTRPPATAETLIQDGAELADWPAPATWGAAASVGMGKPASGARGKFGEVSTGWWCRGSRQRCRSPKTAPKAPRRMPPSKVMGMKAGQLKKGLPAMM